MSSTDHTEMMYLENDECAQLAKRLQFDTSSCCKRYCQVTETVPRRPASTKSQQHCLNTMDSNNHQTPAHCNITTAASSCPNSIFHQLTLRRLCTFLLLCTLFSAAHGCGPGRGIGGPRKNRKLTPLVFKQHVPNMSERTIGASGLQEGAIKRDSPNFKNLVPNYNKDIIFKDDEGSGADRLMSRRCKEKLNILAFSVMNQWPGVRLRVTESWDEDNGHHADSLHYEGRAVDITTSDRDRAKYGMLARLAVEAGFDWVYYESRAHIHCSVKSDSQHIPHVSGCFSANSSILTASGERKLMRDLRIGDRVLSMSSTGQPIFSEVILFMDRNLEQLQDFVEIYTDGGATLTVTPAHLVLVWNPAKELLDYVFADRVEQDDFVLVNDVQGHLRPQRVVRLGVSRQRGFVAPLTNEGTIVVNSVAASCYAIVKSQRLAHWGLAPMRLMATVKAWLGCGSDVAATGKQISATKNVLDRTAAQRNGVHWYAKTLYTIKDYLVPQEWRYQ